MKLNVKPLWKVLVTLVIKVFIPEFSKEIIVRLIYLVLRISCVRRVRYINKLITKFYHCINTILFSYRAIKNK